MTITSTYENDLGFVRHQLESLAFVRAECWLSASDENRYRKLCEKERFLLAKD